MTRREEFKVYAQHVLALFVPNREAPAHKVDPNEAGKVEEWGPDDLDTLIEEGRRQLDRQNDDLERIRSRAQVLLALGLALVATVAALQGRASDSDCVVAWVLWILGLAAGAWSILGAAATSVAKADMQMIHATVLSRYSPPVRKRLAQDYAEIAMDGENQLATRLTNLRHAVSWLLIAGLLALATWLVTPDSDPAPTESCCHQVSETE